MNSILYKKTQNKFIKFIFFSIYDEHCVVESYKLDNDNITNSLAKHSTQNSKNNK